MSESERRLEELLAEHREQPAESPDATESPERPGAGTPRDQHPTDPFDPLADLLDEAASAGDPADEADPADPADPADDLPDAPLFALLRSVEDEVDVDRIDRIWIFPPRRLEVGETAVVVVAAVPELDDDRRRVYAAHYTAHSEAREFRLALAEYGTAPTERVGRLVEEVVHRIKEGPAGAPSSHDIGGREDRWHDVLHQLAHQYLEEVQKNPRLRR